MEFLLLQSETQVPETVVSACAPPNRICKTPSRHLPAPWDPLGVGGAAELLFVLVLRPSHCCLSIHLLWSHTFFALSIWFMTHIYDTCVWVLFLRRTLLAHTSSGPQNPWQIRAHASHLLSGKDQTSEHILDLTVSHTHKCEDGLPTSERPSHANEKSIAS